MRRGFSLQFDFKISEFLFINKLVTDISKAKYQFSNGILYRKYSSGIYMQRFGENKKINLVLILPILFCAS